MTFDDPTDVDVPLSFRRRMMASDLNDLDRVPAGLARCLRMLRIEQEMKDRLKEPEAPPWVQKLYDTLFPEEIESWCGYKGEKSEAHARTSPVFAAHLELLVTWGLLELGSLREAIAVVSYFEVEKFKPEQTLARAIIDCRRADKLVGKSPAMKLVTPPEVARLLTYFKKPFFAVADKRHWFHQIPLPRCVRRLFTIRAGASRIFRALAFPMGFSWSPFAAQGLSMWFAMHAAKKCGFTVEEGSEEWAPLAVVVKDAKGRLVAFITLYLDNVLVIADNLPIRDQLVASLQRTYDHFGVRLKDADSPEGAWKLTHMEVEYIGVEWKLDSNRGLQWRHCPKNRFKWDLTLNCEVLTRRSVVKLVGICIWDWVVSNNTRHDLQPVLAYAKSVEEEQWDSELESIDDTLVRDLKERVRAMCQEQWRDRVTLERETNSVAFTVSDAMKVAGASMELFPPAADDRMQKWSYTNPHKTELNPEQLEMHINETETLMTIQGARDALLRRSGMPSPLCTAIFGGTDNRTAQKAMRTFFFPTSIAVTEELMKLHQELLQERSLFVPVRIAGEIIAADAPSRDQPVDTELVDANGWILKEASDLWERRWKRPRD